MAHRLSFQVKKCGLLTLGCFAITFCFFIPRAHAAPLNFTSATPLILTSPSTTLTVATGSVADTLTVNATSVVVGLSATTGGTFTLLSPSYALSVATSSVGGTATISCASGATTLLLAQNTGSATYTITPTSGACAPTTSSASSQASSVSVGGAAYLPPAFEINGGASATPSSIVTLSFATPPTVSSFDLTTTYGTQAATATSSYVPTLSLNFCAGFSSCASGTYTISVDYLDVNGNSLATSSESISYLPTGTSAPPATPSSTPPATTSTITSIPKNATATQLEAILTELETELQTLLKEAAAKGIMIQGVSSNIGPASPYVFTRNLTLWDQGKDVNELQRYLVAEDKGPAAEALARHGTTETFGPLTFAALKEFQKAVGIVPDSGYFGPITRGYIRTHGE